MSDTKLMERQDRETVERLEPAPRRRSPLLPMPSSPVSWCSSSSGYGWFQSPGSGRFRANTR